MTPDPAALTDLIAALHPPRLPEEFTALGWDDLLAALGLGLLLAALLLLLFGPLLTRRTRPPRLSARLAVIEALPAHEHLLALARLGEEQGIALPEGLRAGLYTRDPGDPARLAEVIRSGRVEKSTPNQDGHPKDRGPQDMLGAG